jgi:hypothetical protein
MSLKFSMVVQSAMNQGRQAATKIACLTPKSLTGAPFAGMARSRSKSLSTAPENA